MKIIGISLLLLSSFIASKTLASPPLIEALFSSGDRIRGQALKLTQDQDFKNEIPLLARGQKESLHWNSSDFESPLILNPKKLLRLQVINSNVPSFSPYGKHKATVTLTNQSELHGELLSLSPERIQLRTPYAGELSINPSMVQALEISDHDKVILSGEPKLEDWDIISDEEETQAQWSVERHAFSAPKGGTMLRQLELPQRWKMSMQLEWENRFNMIIGFNINNNESDDTLPETGFFAQVNGHRSIRLEKRFFEDGDHKIMPLESAISFQNINALHQGEKGKLEIYADLKKGEYACYLNGIEIFRTLDSNPASKPQGKYIMIQSLKHAPIMRLSQLEVSHWSGKLPSQIDANRLKNEISLSHQSGRMVRLRNGDALKGSIGKIENGLMELQTDIATLQIPINRLAKIDLTSNKKEIPRLYPGDVRAWLKHGGFIVFQLHQISPTSLSGYSQPFGKAQFDLNAFSLIETNIYNDLLHDQPQLP